MPKCVIIIILVVVYCFREIIEECHLVMNSLYTMHDIMLVYLGLHYCLVFNCECTMDTIIFSVQEVYCGHYCIIWCPKWCTLDTINTLVSKKVGVQWTLSQKRCPTDTNIFGVQALRCPTDTKV